MRFRLAERAGVRFMDDYGVAPQRLAPLLSLSGCEFEEGPLGSCIKTDPMKATSVAGIFACGDAARGAGNVAFAVGDGAMAGAATHRRLMFG